MKVLLVGISGVYNFGCEAIVRGTYEILNELYPGIQVDYEAKECYEYDKEKLKDCPVNVVKYHKRFSLKNILYKIISKLSIPVTFYRENKEILKSYDAVFSIGGDIYNIYSDGSYPIEHLKFGDRCEKLGVPYILWGCSVGPYEGNPKIKEIFIRHLKKISLIVARENSTIQYLKENGIEKHVVFSYDPAYYVKYDVTDIPSERTIGINLSPLSINYYSSIKRSDSIKIYTEVITELINLHKYKVILIPHVLDCGYNDNDYLYLKEIYNNIAINDKEKIEIIDKNLGFVGTKKYIKKCNVVIAARMHCAINALSSETPSMLLSYSEKSKGMADLIYGDTRYCKPITFFKKENTSEIVSLINDIKIPSDIKNRISDKSNLKKALDELIIKKEYKK